jgi:hypothetical protein
VKLLHQVRPDLLRDLEARSLRSTLADRDQELADVRRELAEARAALTEAQTIQAEIDDLLDLAGSYSLTAPAERLTGRDRWPWDRWPCHDVRSLTTDQAHVVMRQHLRCDTGVCTVRTTAVRTLRDAGLLAPDSHRPGLAAHL